MRTHLRMLQMTSLLTFLLISGIKAQTWSSLNGGMNAGGLVFALAVDGSGNLYAGGQFTTAGGVSATRIARWDGAAWSPVGNGFNSTVWALTASGSSVYAGGDFTASGSFSVTRIAKWDGSNWSALGNGVNSTVNALAIDGSGNLYAGGKFTTAGSVSADHIAKWNGSTWSALGGGVNGVVDAVAVDASGNLYVGGNFSDAGGVAVNNIAKWDGSTWSTLGTGLNGEVRALVLDASGVLYAGGSFTTTGPPENKTMNHIAKWNGTDWISIGNGTDNAVWALAFDALGTLYAGGDFNNAGGTTVNRIAKWNGSKWSDLGSGANKRVRALTIQGGILYAGGNFTTMNGLTVNYVAKYGDILIPVELMSFQASAIPQGVELTWSTASETENLGFHIFRSGKIDGVYRQITKQMIPGQGNTAKQHTYRYVDTDIEAGKVYFYKLADVDYNGRMTLHGPVSIMVSPMPTEYRLLQNFPNPFNPETTIGFTLPEASRVRLDIYNISGRLVRTLVAEEMPAGYHAVTWNARDDAGVRMASGVYIYRLSAGAMILQRKLVLMK